MFLIPGVSIGDSVQQGLDAFFAFVPNLLAFLAIVVIGYFVAKALKALVTKGLQKLGMDRALSESDAGSYVERLSPGASPASGVGRVVFYLVFAFFFFSAIGALQIPALTTFMNDVLAYLPNVIAAIAIFVVAAVVAGAVSAAAVRLMGDTPTGKIVAAVAPALVMVISVFMILNQLRIAEEIVTIAFASIMGAIALAMALAFGLGGRDVASRMLEDAYQSGRDNKDQVKQDLQTAKDRGEQEAGRAQRRFDGGTDATAPQPGRA